MAAIASTVATTITCGDPSPHHPTVVAATEAIHVAAQNRSPLIAAQKRITSSDKPRIRRWAGLADATACTWRHAGRWVARKNNNRPKLCFFTCCFLL